MRRSPLDAKLRVAVHRELSRAWEEPVTLWVGFDNEVHLKVFGHLLSTDTKLAERAFRHFLCWKALLHVRVYDWGQSVTVMLTGTGEVYTARMSTSGSMYSGIRWVNPEEIDVLEIKELGRWDAPQPVSE